MNEFNFVSVPNVAFHGSHVLLNAVSRNTVSPSCSSELLRQSNHKEKFLFVSSVQTFLLSAHLIHSHMGGLWVDALLRGNLCCRV